MRLNELKNEIKEYEELLENAEYGSSEYDFYDCELQFLTVKLARLEKNQ